MARYFEDLSAGEVGTLGTYRMTEAEIVEFASRYDPLPIHTDESVAEASEHGGLIASGFHTFSAVNSVVTVEFKRDLAVVAGLGIDDLRWHAPVRPGDELTVELSIPELRRSETDPDRGIYRLSVSGHDTDGGEVISYVDSGLVRVRGDGG
ncbi:MaoC/PaaZ C-terminal domain-containing protein [Haloarchaeobius litoreus]|uniref:MaoC/PaaZ C-terminal domain-containing protein n=1 Tax=Haloarchaeobius litoreus TaxID=755306 RepID=A0ABD6DQV4_9EURY|nr:MaoC/PaaZ C-terminal domain-containing protein [Haloarchaeobius litoreus]